MIPAARREPAEVRVGWTLATVGSLLTGLLDAAHASRVIEIGSGPSTATLAAWAGRVGATLVTVDPDPSEEVRRLAATDPSVTLLATTGLEALAGLDAAGAYLLDGDHNHYTVSAELRAVARRAAGAGSRPLVLVGGTAWPWGGRDQYHRPGALPPGAVHPHVWGGAVPGETGTVGGGWSGAGRWALARREGGAANGVRTAVDDYTRSDRGWRSWHLPVCGGLSVLGRRDATWTGSVDDLVGPLVASPVLAELEADRAALAVRLLDALDGEERERQRSADALARAGAATDAARAELDLRRQVDRTG